jgi:replicative DNA helicase
VDKIREKHQFSLLETGMSVAVDAFENADLGGALAAMSGVLAQIAIDVPNTRDTDITTTGNERLARYLEYKDMSGHLRGIPTGFTFLDNATLGWQKENFVLFVGPPKAGKSTMLLLAAIAVHLFGLRPLVFTFEMSTDEMTERMDAIRAKVGHTRLRSGDLSKEEWRKLRRYLHQIENMPPFWFSSDTMSATTLSGVGAKIDQYKPDIVFVDGIYMMIDEVTGESNTPQSLTNLTRGFKRMAQNKEMPIAATTQVLLWKMDRKKGITANSIGYSSSFAQDADVIIGVENTQDDNTQKVKVVEARNVGKVESFVRWDWDEGTFVELEENPFTSEGGEDWDSKGTKF